MSLALDLCKKYPDFVWNTEVAWPEDNYLSMMPKDRREEFIKYAKFGQIGCQAIYGNMLTGICSHESFIRDLYYAHNVAKQYGIPFDMAVSSDVPTQVWTLPTVLSGAGIKYFSAGLNLTRGDSFNKLFHRPFYWQGPDGGKVLTWLNNQYAQASSLGLLGSVETAKRRVWGWVASFDRDDYPYDAVLAFGGVSDNQPLQPSLASVVQEWNKRYEYPKIIFTRGPEFFRHIEKNFAGEIPTISGDGGVYWEDGAASSAKETADVRIAKEQLATAEKIYSLLSTYGIADYPKAEIDAAWKNAMLYDEHTWGAHCSISQPANDQTIHQWNYKKRFATLSEGLSQDLLEHAMADLAKAVGAKEGDMVVFNPLNWPVSGFVRPVGGAYDIWADDVPPLGHKVISTQKSSVVQLGDTIENRFYRIEVNPATGALKSLFDKDLSVELVDSSAPYGINQYVYIKGLGGEMVDAAQVSAPSITVDQLTGGRIAVKISGSALKVPTWTTDIILYNTSKRIDFVNRLQKTETYDKEAGYFAFPFNLDKPEFYVELPDGVVKPKSQMLPGACMQWYCAQDFVAAADAKCAVVWSAVESPLITLGDINRETFKSPLPIENGHLYAYAFNNYWSTNYKASQGDMEFSFSLTSMRQYDPVAASRFGQSVRQPLVAWRMAGRGASAGIPRSLLSVSADNVSVQAVKQAESGEGLIVRLRELSGKQTEATLMLPKGKFKEAWSCNLVEDPTPDLIRGKLKLSADQVTVTVPAHGMATVWVK
jgi:alpha-mannosidase